MLKSYRRDLRNDSVSGLSVVCRNLPLNTADSPLPPATDPVLFERTGVQGGG
jgi:hypothetical protein